MYYDPSVYSGKGVELVYNLINESESIPPTNAECVRSLIKHQVTLLPKSLNFDYRQPFGDENDSTFKYMNDELMGFVDNITKSDRGLHQEKWVVCPLKKDEMYHDVFITRNMMDPSVTFLQTLIGLACYAQGVCDKGWNC